MSEPTGPTPYGYPTGPAPLSAGDERTWGMVAHLSSFVAAYVALGLIGPAVVMATMGQRSAFVRRHAVEALNFNISVLIYAAVSGVLAFVLIGIPMLVALAVLYLVTTIQGAMAANRGEEYRYPLTIRFVS
ncbi:DUF4870 domain-containing protein [Kineosporia sp. R_H_3]|uniref:DUF4870 domain-containing protein n=1 Tax=Kineosporia sp. R_H_3 TaxID=1961848 RepID=UPI0018EA02FC|nr:DUF4870 domain-containing protein [Kineosporia sp. R_H_3]